MLVTKFKKLLSSFCLQRHLVGLFVKMYTLRSKVYGAINKIEEILPASWWDKFTTREDPPAKLLVECIEPITRNQDKLSLEFLENAVNKVSAVMQVSVVLQSAL